MDMNWLAGEARQIHDLFSSVFYSFVLLLISIGVVMNFFKMPMGQVPEFLHLVGRAVLAAFILVAFPEIMNALANVTDELSKNVGQLNNFKLVLGKAGEKIGTLTWSWVSVKDSVLLLISYITYFLLYASVYVADSLYLFVWTLMYVFSPLLIAAFTLPVTASATKGLFKSLIEVCLWKICWSVLAALLWSFALSKINNPQYDIDFLTAIILNLMLAFSVVLTPFIVRGFIGGGLSGIAASTGGAILASAAMTPTGMIAKAKGGAGRVVGKFRGDGSDSEKSEKYEYRNMKT